MNSCLGHTVTTLPGEHTSKYGNKWTWHHRYREIQSRIIGSTINFYVCSMRRAKRQSLLKERRSEPFERDLLWRGSSSIRLWFPSSAKLRQAWQQLRTKRALVVYQHYGTSTDSPAPRPWGANPEMHWQTPATDKSRLSSYSLGSRGWQCASSIAPHCSAIYRVLTSSLDYPQSPAIW